MSDEMTDCLFHQDCRAYAVVNNTRVCYECWNNGTPQEKEWIRMVVHKYQHGLITKEEMHQELTDIALHQADPTYPVHISK